MLLAQPELRKVVFLCWAAPLIDREGLVHIPKALNSIECLTHSRHIWVLLSISAGATFLLSPSVTDNVTV